MTRTMPFRIIGCLLVVAGIVAIQWVVKYGPETNLVTAGWVFRLGLVGIGIGTCMVWLGQAFFDFFRDFYKWKKRP